jgi:hypothetical protein
VSRTEWRPLVTDLETQTSLTSLLREIVEATITAEMGSRKMVEHADHAVLRAYLAQDGVVADPDNVGGTALTQAVTIFADGGASAGLYGGGAGLGWTVEHLAGGEMADAVCAMVDAALLRELEGEWDRHYDLIGGLVGFGVYAIERGDSGRLLAARVLDHLERLARPHGGGLAWHTPASLLPSWQSAVAPDGYWNLGLAHGTPGVIAMLARYVASDVEVERARSLLHRAVGFLLAAEPPSGVGRYPAWHPPRGGRSRRLAWCYGDLGVSIAILSAAITCGDDRWRTEAVDLARACATVSFDDARVFDAGLCHGAIGVAHLFNRMHHATGEVLFAVAALRWLDRTLALRNHHPIAGFPSRHVEDGVATWTGDTSLLTGATGVALVLHAMITDVEPTWDRLLLVDVGPR